MSVYDIVFLMILLLSKASRSLEIAKVKIPMASTRVRYFVQIKWINPSPRFEPELSFHKLLCSKISTWKTCVWIILFCNGHSKAVWSLSYTVITTNPLNFFFNVRSVGLKENDTVSKILTLYVEILVSVVIRYLGYPLTIHHSPYQFLRNTLCHIFLG